MMQVTIHGFDELNKRLKDPQIRAFAKDAMDQATALVAYEAARYPPQITGRPYPWKSQKQRRYVIAAIRRGEIVVPYRRTGTLGQRWESKVKWNGKELIGEVSNKTAYAPYVQGLEQNPFHKEGGWQVLTDVAEKQMNAITAFFHDALTKMRNYLAGG